MLRLCPALPALLLTPLLAWPGAASAATVAIVSPPSPAADVTEALTRLRGELLSVGLEVTMAERPAARGWAGVDSLTWLEPLAAEHTASAVIDTIGDDALRAVDVWVVKTHPRRFEVTRVAAEPKTPNPSERLALRAIEALRAGLLEVDWAARRRRDDAATPPPKAVPPATTLDTSARPRERLGVEAGAAALMSLDGVGPAVLPVLRVGWAARPWLLVQAACAGFGSRPTISTSGGAARVAQQYGLLGARYRFGADRRLWPFVALAAGVLHTSVAGEPSVATDGHTVQQWSFLVDGSFGAGLRLFGRTYLTLAAHVHVAAPYVAIHLVEEVAATSGRPNLLLTLAVGTWL